MPNFDNNSHIEIENTEKVKQIYLLKSKQKKFPYTEAQLLKGLTAISAHAEIIANISDNERDE